MKTIIKVKNGFVREIVSDENGEFFVFDCDTEEILDDALYKTTNGDAFIFKLEAKEPTADDLVAVEQFKERELTNDFKNLFNKGSD